MTLSYVVFTHPDVVSGREGFRLTPADVAVSNRAFMQHLEWTLDHSANGYAAMAAKAEPTLWPGDEVVFADFGAGVVEEVHLYEYTRHEPELILAPGLPSDGQVSTQGSLV